LPHNFGLPLTYLFGDQIRIYRAPNSDGNQPADDQFAMITTLSIDPNQALTAYIDANGGGDYWYKAVFVNSHSSAATSLALATARRGDTGYHYVTIDAIRREAGFSNAPFISDDMIDEKRQFAEAETTSALTGVYALPLPLPINPNVVNACLQIAAGLLMSAQYTRTNAALAKQGDAMAKRAAIPLN
jgi:hypothetical protein